MPQTLPAIILAAGLSSRMGMFKPLLPLDGTPLISHVISALQASGCIAPLIVVTGHRAAELAAALPQGVTQVENPHYATGEMLSSLKAGIQKAQILAPAAPGFLLAFADQPAVLSHTIQHLVTAFLDQLSSVALPVHAGKKGHPILLSSTLIPEILALAPDQTLRDVVHRHLPQAALIPVDDPAVLEDLDTPDDFVRAQSRLAQKPY